MSIPHLMALHSIMDIGSARIRGLVEYFGDAQVAWDMPSMWREAIRLSAMEYENIMLEHKSIDPYAVYEKFMDTGAKIVTEEDDDYPHLLRHINDAPYLLYYKGTLPKENDLAIGIIGARRATAYGKEVAEFFGRELAQAGVWSISGLARGIDSCGHKGSLAGGGKTIGVLGCGIDVVYPRENKALFEEVAANGCVITDYPLGMQPLGKNFPVRNRIISGMSNGIIVVEAMLKSGTKITVDYALAQGKNVYAVPGSIFSPLSKGTHHMMKSWGAKMVTDIQDILEDFPNPLLEFGEVHVPSAQGNLFVPQFETVQTNYSPDEAKLLDILTMQRHFNDVAVMMEMDAGSLATLLTMCELKGYINRLDGQYYIRKNI